MDLIEFATLVRKLREAQRQFFKTRASPYLYESKALERIVDRKIEELLSPGLFDAKTEKR